MPDDDGLHDDALAARADDDLALIVSAGEAAGRIAMRYFRNDPDVWYKHEGRSPVSVADMEVDAYLKDALRAARPQYGWLSEETEDERDRMTRDCVFVVDPIDGTRAFVAGKDVWCVSIAVVRRGLPIAGVLVAPALGEVFAASHQGPATRNGAKLSIGDMRQASPDDPLRFAAPETLILGVADKLGRPVMRMPHVPSLAYRLAMVADGRLDATLVLPRASDWDIAAADLILKQAGGAVMSLDAREIVYNRSETDHGILIAARNAMMPALVGVVAGLQPVVGGRA